MQHIIRSVRSVWGDERAATMPEYALMVALIAVVCVAAVTLVGGNANNIFNQIAAAIAAG